MHNNKQLSAAVAPLVSAMTAAGEVAANVFARAVTEHPATVETSANVPRDAASALHAVSSYLASIDLGSAWTSVATSIETFFSL